MKDSPVSFIFDFGQVRAFGFLLTVVVLVIMVGGCGGKRTEKRPEQKNPPRPPLGVTVSQSETIQQDDQGRPIWRLSAKSLKLDEGRVNAVLEDGTAEIYSEGKPDMVVKAGRIEANGLKRTLSALEGVYVASRSQNLSFRANRVTVDLVADRVLAEGGLKMTSQYGEFGAGKLEGGIKMDKIILGGPGGVRGTLVKAIR